jgi:hypothetical protein
MEQVPKPHPPVSFFRQMLATLTDFACSPPPPLPSAKLRGSRSGCTLPHPSCSCHPSAGQNSFSVSFLHTQASFSPKIPCRMARCRASAAAGYNRKPLPNHLIISPCSSKRRHLAPCKCQSLPRTALPRSPGAASTAGAWCCWLLKQVPGASDQNKRELGVEM